MKIGRRTRALQVLVWYFLFAAIGSEPGSASSYSSNPTKIGRSFSVVVLHDSKPVRGLQIELRTNPKADVESSPVSTVTTNDAEVSEFRNIKPGPYYISIKHVAFAQSIEIVVDSRHANACAEKVTFDWPGAKALSARSVSGLLNAVISTGNPLNDLAHPTFGPLGEAKLKLVHAVSGEIIESQTASESGAFEFKWVLPGLYMLQVEMPESARSHYHAEEGYVPIEIDSSANASTINLYLSPGICGSLGYENRQEAAAQ